MCSSRRLKPRAISYPVQYRPFRYPIGAAFGSGKSGIQKQQLKKQNSSKSNDFEEFWCAVMDFSPPGLLVHRLSQGQIRAVSVSIWSILPPFAWRIFRCFCQVPSSPISFRVKSRSKAFLQLRRMKYISLLHYDLVDYPRKRRFISSAGSVPSCPSSIAYISSHRVSMSS